MSIIIIFKSSKEASVFRGHHLPGSSALFFHLSSVLSSINNKHKLLVNRKVQVKNKTVQYVTTSPASSLSFYVAPTHLFLIFYTIEYLLIYEMRLCKLKNDGDYICYICYVIYVRNLKIMENQNQNQEKRIDVCSHKLVLRNWIKKS